MRILHLTWSFSPLSETFVYDLIRETAARADVLVVTRRRENALARPFDPVRVVDRGGLAGRLCDAVRAWVSRPPVPAPSWLAVRRTLDAAAASFRPDVIHAQFGQMGVLAAPVAARRGIPLLTTFHGCDASRDLRDAALVESFGVLAAGRNRVIAVSEFVGRALARAGLDPRRIDVLRNGKDLSRYPFHERRGPATRLVSVGRLVEKKGHADALVAMARLAGEGLPFELEIVGEGPLGPDLRARAAALGVADRVRFLGPLDHATTVARMDAADALLLCSRTAASGDSEGLPMVLLEAQALGLPCVSTTHAGIPEGVPAPNHWLLAPEGDVGAIAANLRRLRSSSPEELAEVSRRGRAHVQAEHDLSRQMNGLMEVYRATAA